jgi:hypothetical protein
MKPSVIAPLAPASHRGKLLASSLRTGDGDLLVLVESAQLSTVALYHVELGSRATIHVRR